MSNISTNLKKFVFCRFEEDLLKKNFLVHEKEFWVYDTDSDDWFLIITSEGNLCYNQVFFSRYLPLFSLTGRDLSNLIKDWVEKRFPLRINNVSRRKANFQWNVVSKKTNEKKLKLNERFGFGYDFVKRYLGISNFEKELVLEDFIQVV